jgi:hypothetical protein
LLSGDGGCVREGLVGGRAGEWAAEWVVVCVGVELDRDAPRSRSAFAFSAPNSGRKLVPLNPVPAGPEIEARAGIDQLW